MKRWLYIEYLLKFSMREMSLYRIATVLLVITGGVLILTSDEGIFVSSRQGGSGVSDQSHQLCSVVTTSYKGQILLGGNVDIQPKDFSGTAPLIFFFPARDKDSGYGSGYGFVALGWYWKEKGVYHENFPCSMNEKGLACGTNGLPDVPLNPHPERPFSVASEFFQIKAMRECSNVACVIEMAENFDWGSSSISLNQLHFADPTGDAVIISAGKDGELAFTRKGEKDTYLISTNFNRANHENGKHPCWRYDTAVTMMKGMKNDSMSMDYFESILDAIHLEGALVNTSFSYVFDLKNSCVYLYYFHQFEEAVKLNVTEELASDNFSTYDSLITSSQRLPELFSQETRANAASEFQGYRRRFLIIAVLLVSLCIAGFSGIFYFIYKRMKNRHKEGV